MKKILLVEDEPFIALLAEQILEREGYRVHCAEHGREALDMLDDIRPDLILTDNMMPFVDGLKLCRAIREQPAFASTPIVMMSAGKRPAGADSLVNAFLQKPFMVDDLLSVVETMLNRDAERRSGSD